ncbi:hypothetical protein B0J14DRAFT_606814 [Halenospora varia]|nr:hypothetical protein B0J14DRAFT_606814 [Halenospora varia]
MRTQIFLSAAFLLFSSFTGLASATANAGASDFSLESANSNHLFPRQACGSTPGPCNKNNCQGISKQDGSLGVCTVAFKGFSCTSTCSNNLGDCNKNGCAGTNSLGGGRGFCTAGDFKGCTCNSVCSDDSKACDANGCNGVNGFCTAGDFNGCPCGTSCGNLKTEGCDKNGGNGLAGCPCTGTCGATPGPCNKNGCNGSNGRCTAGAFNGCACN